MSRNEVVIRLVLPKWSARRWVAIATVALAVGGAMAWAWMPPPLIAKGDPLKSQYFNDAFASLAASVTALEARATSLEAPVCPRGYAQMADNNYPNAVVCKKGSDEMVRVGGWRQQGVDTVSGPEVFWIDRYEASVWDKPAGMGTPQPTLVNGGNAVVAGFPPNGQFTTPLYAASVPGVAPATLVTWFQAVAACRLAGKHLVTDEEWLAAAAGTPDSGDNNGTKNGECVTGNGMGGPAPAPNNPRKTGGLNVPFNNTRCASAWGAQDMIGNVWEWTGQWYAAPSWPSQPNYQTNVLWGRADYNGDGLWNIASSVFDDAPRSGHPAAAIRGGHWSSGTQAGVFALNLDHAPSSWSTNIGFRCAAR